MGFATNIFLTFAVYLTILAQNLPETSKPMSTMVYYLVIMLAVSSLTTFVTILSLRIYAKEEDNTPVPWVLIYISNVKKMFVAKPMRSPAVGGNTNDRELRIPRRTMGMIMFIMK
jgi:hypothetical protein